MDRASNGGNSATSGTCGGTSTGPGWGSSGPAGGNSGGLLEGGTSPGGCHSARSTLDIVRTGSERKVLLVVASSLDALLTRDAAHRARSVLEPFARNLGFAVDARAIGSMSDA